MLDITPSTDGPLPVFRRRGAYAAGSFQAVHAQPVSIGAEKLNPNGQFTIGSATGTGHAAGTAYIGLAECLKALWASTTERARRRHAGLKDRPYARPRQ